MNEPHLFRCEQCRADWRVRRAWKRLPGLARLEADQPVDERFVERVLASLREDRRKRALLALKLAAAAALIFFFFAGAGRQTATASAAGEEQAFSQLAPSADSTLDDLLPE
jgi:ferric-dicitrate binding protein FerR (iron transport regulator)